MSVLQWSKWTVEIDRGRFKVTPPSPKVSRLIELAAEKVRVPGHSFNPDGDLAEGIAAQLTGAVVSEYGEGFDAEGLAFGLGSAEAIKAALEDTLKGGPGSGHWGHSGRPGHRGGSAPANGASPYSAARPMDDPAFRAWFGKSAAVNPDGSPKVFYHGTQHDFQVFEPNGDSIMLDRFLGTHVAEDPGIASRFAFGLYGDKDAWGNYQPKGGNVMPVYLSIQHPKELTGRGSDQAIMERDIVTTVYDQSDLTQFLEWWDDRWAGTSPPEAGTRAYKLLKAGQEIDKNDPDFKVAGFTREMAKDHEVPFSVGGYVALSGLGFGMKRKHGKDIVDRYKSILKKQGYDGLTYENTSPMETGDIAITYHQNPGDYWEHATVEKFPASTNRRAWVAFEPWQIKSVFNQGTFNPHDPNILKEALISRLKGGKGSGNFGHAGRPGHVGGSAPGKQLMVAGTFGDADLDRLGYMPPDSQSQMGRADGVTYRQQYARELAGDPIYQAGQKKLLQARENFQKAYAEYAQSREQIKKYKDESGFYVKTGDLKRLVSTIGELEYRLEAERSRLYQSENAGVLEEDKAHQVEYVNGLRVRVAGIEKELTQAKGYADGIRNDPDYQKGLRMEDEAKALVIRANKEYEEAANSPEIQAALDRGMQAAERIRSAAFGKNSFCERSKFPPRAEYLSNHLLALESERDDADTPEARKAELTQQIEAGYKEVDRIAEQSLGWNRYTRALEAEITKVAHPGDFEIDSRPLTLLSNVDEEIRTIQKFSAEGSKQFGGVVTENPLFDYLPASGSAPRAKQPVAIDFTPLGRAGTSEDTARIHASHIDPPPVYVHELGHALEGRDPVLKALANRYLESRTQGEYSQRLIDLDPGSSYDKSEIVKKDKFFNPYCGKIYENHATEIISMGVAALTSSPYVLARDDPGYFNFIYALTHLGDVR